MATNFGFTSGSGLTSGGITASVYPSLKRVRISDAAGADGVSLLSAASAPSDYKLRTVQGVNGVVTTVAGDNIQMSGAELSQQIASLNLVVNKKTQQLDLYESESAVGHARLSYVDQRFRFDRDLSVVTDLLGEVRVGESVRGLQTDLKTQVDKEASDVKNLNTLISNENICAAMAEMNLSARIDLETERSTNVETDLYAKTTSLLNTDTSFAIQLAAETKARQDTDVALDGKITFEKNRALAAEDLLNVSLNAEIKRATDADTKHTADLKAEETRAMGRETALQSQLYQETLQRIDAETKLTSDLNAEISTRIEGVNAVTSDLKTKYEAIDTAFGNFVAVATSRDEYLNQKCDFIMKNTDPAAIDSLSELVNRQNSVALGVYSRLQMLEDILSTLIGRPIYDPGERPEILAPMVGPTMDPPTALPSS